MTSDRFRFGARTERLMFVAAAAVIIAVFIWRNQPIIDGALGGFEQWHAAMAGDSGRYTAGADALLAGKPLTGKQPSYIGYIATLALLKSLGLTRDWITIVHLILEAVAAVALYDLGRNIGGRLTGLLAAFIYVENPGIAIWNGFILTDSFYAALVILAVWSVHGAFEKRKLWIPAAILTVTAAALARPNGWILFPAAAIFWIVCDMRSRWLRVAGVAAVVAAFGAAAAMAPAFYRGIESERPGVMLMKGKAIWGDDSLNLAMPPEPELKGADWKEAAVYVARHPAASATLATWRVLVSLAHVRPQYPFRQNAHYAVMLSILYVSALAGFAASFRKALALALSLAIAGHMLTIALTFADVDGRFLLYYLPLIGVFSAHGIALAAVWLADFIADRRWL